jgi:hypothetical protein
MVTKQCNAGRSREIWKGKKKKAIETSQMVKILNLFLILALFAIRMPYKEKEQGESPRQPE